jgi:hypothetical protein
MNSIRDCHAVCTSLDTGRTHMLEVHHLHVFISLPAILLAVYAVDSIAVIYLSMVLPLLLHHHFRFRCLPVAGLLNGSVTDAYLYIT